MNTHADKAQKSRSRSVADNFSQVQSGGESPLQFVDRRPEASAHRKLQELGNNSPQVKQLQAAQAMAKNFTAQQRPPIQEKENKTGLPESLKSGIENLSGCSIG